MAVFTAIGSAAFGAGTFLAGLTAAGLQLAAGIGLSLISKATAGSPDSEQSSILSVNGRIRGGDDVPRSINLGWNVTAGSMVYNNTWGDANTYLTQVIALGDAPIRELREVFVDGNGPVTLDTGNEHSSYGYPVTEYRKSGVDHLWIKFYDGTQTTADSFLTGTVASTEYPYASTRVGVGIPYIIATSRAPERSDGNDTALFNGFPNFKFATYGLKLYDPSKDTSVGGSGAQRWATPSTWGGGDGDFLPPVQAYNILRGISVDSDWLYGLQTTTAEQLPVSNWIAAINKARTSIDGPDGSEATYRSGGEVQVNAPISETLDALMTTCQGRLVESGGSYKIYIGAAGSSVASFTDNDILSTEEQSFSPFYGLADSVNGIQATYPNPAEAWNTKSAPPIIRSDLEALDGDRRLMSSVSLDFVPYPGQVQRLMQSALLEAQRARRHTIVLGPDFWILEPGDIISWTSERNGYTSKLFRVDGVIDKSNLDVVIDITEVDADDYDWDQENDYTAPFDGSISIVAPPPLANTSWAVYADAIEDENGNNRRPTIRVEYASGLSDVQSVRVQVRASGQTLPFFDAEVPYGSPHATRLTGQFTANTVYEVRGIFVRSSNGLSSWSSWLEVTTDDIRLINTDMSAEVNEYRIALAKGLDKVRNQIRDLALTTGAMDMRNQSQIAVVTDQAFAAVTVESEARVTADEAFSSQLTTTISEFNDSFAGTLFKMESIAAADGWDARIAFMVRAGTGDSFVQGGLYMDAKTSGETRMFADFDKFLVRGEMVSVNSVKSIDWDTGAESTVWTV